MNSQRNNLRSQLDRGHTNSPIAITAPKVNRGTERKTKRKKKSKRGGIAPSERMVALPAVYHLTADTLGFKLSTTLSIPNDSITAGGLKRAIALWPGTIGATDYSALGNYFPVLAGLKSSYARFMISSLKVMLTCTSAYTSGGYLACNFEADSTGVSGPPSSLGDVTNANVYAIATPGDHGTYHTMVSDYFNDWKNCTQTSDDPADIVDAGIIQVYGQNNTATGLGVGLLTLEVDFYFSGYRSTE